MYGTDLNFYVMNNVMLTPSGELINEKYDIKGSWVGRNAAIPQEGQKATCKYCNQSYIHSRRPISTKRFDLNSNGNRSKSSQDSTDSSDKGVTDRLSVIMKAVGAVVRPNDAELRLERDREREREKEKERNRCPFTVLGLHEPNVILKDNDLKHKVRIPQRTSFKMYTQLKSDAEFLSTLNIMDYSLLIGVHNTEYEVEEEEDDDALAHAMLGIDGSGSDVSDSGSEHASTTSRMSTMKRVTSVSKSRAMIGDSSMSVSIAHPPPSEQLKYNPNFEKSPMKSSNSSGATPVKFGSARHVKRVQVSRVVGPEMYYFGIVDFQQKWDWSKRVENFIKVRLYGEDRNGLSAIAPQPYKERYTMATTFVCTIFKTQC